MFKKELERGEAGDDVGTLLRGLERDDVKRGMVCHCVYLCVPSSILPCIMNSNVHVS